jgi:hypothetical protein
MNLPPSSWGPFFWHTIHIVALGYPTKPTYGHKKAAKEFIESLAFLIPCPICREHFIQHLKEAPISPFLDRREDLFKWTVTLHNKVNKTLNKPLVSELEAIQFYIRLGKQTRSPVVTPDDFAEADLRAMIKGVALGVAASSVVAASIWYLNKNDT